VSRDPRAPDKVIVLTKAGVAQSQLEAALRLWFHYGDPVSILTLANAANDCYSALGGHARKPSPYRTWLESQSQAFQDRARFVQNWVKHGLKKTKKRPHYAPIIAEVLMYDSVECHGNLFHSKTNLMMLFIARWAAENPSPGNILIRPIILRMFKVQDSQSGIALSSSRKALNDF
jgi:hypothetical protein